MTTRAMMASARRAGPGALGRPLRLLRRGRRLRAFSQLRVRVLAGVLLVIVVTLAAFDYAAIAGLRGYLVGQADGQLQQVVRLYRPLTVNFQVRPAGEATPTQLTGPPVVIGPRVRVSTPLLDQFYAACLSCKGPTVLVGGDPGLRPALPANLAALARSAHAETVQAVAAPNGPLRLWARKVGGGTLVVTSSLSGVNATVARLRLLLIAFSAGAVLIAGLGVAWVARRGLRPIENMAAQADSITAGDLAGRITPLDARTEVGRLSAALNGMLARIEADVAEREASQELMRQFFADASHELRNPLASLRANAELYQQGALPARPQVDEAMCRIGLEARRMSGLVDSMLRLARLDQQPDPAREPVDVSALVTECAQRAMMTDPGRAWTAVIADDLVVTGDEELLRQAIDNLLANVRVHTPDGAPAAITAAACDGQVTIEVADAGPGVPEAQLPRIFDRFYRAGSPSRSGSGLGLAIVTAIAAAHDGSATASAGEPHGLRVTLTLPEHVRARARVLT
jgi:two-component system, OmpR family, sensor kinase